MSCRKRGFHFTPECEPDHQNTARKPKKLRSGLLNTRARDAPAAQRAIMERNSVVSPFLRLPGELRSKIYGYVLGGHALRIGYSPHVRKTKTIKGQRYHVHAGGGLFNRLVEHEVIDHRYEKALSLHLGLLRVCRQVYGEAALLPYAMNTFTFENDWVLRRCFKTLRPTQKRAMTKFAIQYE